MSTVSVTECTNIVVIK